MPDPTPDRRPRRPGRRPLAAGHAILAMLVALLVGTLLNADSLMHTAESMEYGTRRSVATSVMRPVRAVADFLHLTDPRRGLDRALGKTDVGTEEDPFAAFASTTTSTPPTTTEGPAPSTTTTTLAAPTAADPLRVWVAGDSLAFEYGKAVIRAADGIDLLEAVSPVDYQVATGLSRPDRFDWPAELAAGMQDHDPDVVVFMVGSNDDQGVTDPSGTAHGCCDDPGWKAEYARRVGAVMDEVIGQGREIVSVGVPIMGGSTGGRNPHYRIINTIVERQAARRVHAHYLDAYHLFQDDDGGYARFVDGVKLRADDDVHLERAGGDLLAAATLDLLARVYDLSAAGLTPTTTTSSSTPAPTATTTTTTPTTAPARDATGA